MVSVKKRSNAEWRKLVAEYESSGMTQEEWCLANGINYYTFKDRAWRLREMDERGVSGPIFRPNAKSKWVEIKEPNRDQQAEPDKADLAESLPSEPCCGEIRVIIGGFTVAVTDDFNDAAFTRVLKALSGICDARGAACSC